MHEAGEALLSASALRAHAREGFFSEGTHIEISSEPQETILPQMGEVFGHCSLLERLGENLENPNSEPAETARIAILTGLLEGMSLGKITTGQPGLLPFIRETWKEGIETKVNQSPHFLQDVLYDMIRYGLFCDCEITDRFNTKPDSENLWTERLEAESKGRIM